MQENGEWISNNYIRIKNPLSSNNKFIGPANEYDFKESLEPFRIYPQQIYAGQSDIGVSFVVETNSPIVWYKRAATPNSRCANNFLYLGKNKINLSTWLGSSYEKRNELIIAMN